MTVTLETIHRFPVKGLGPQILDATHLTQDQGVLRDRLFAFAHGKTQFNAADPAPVSKTNYLMLMRNERLAELQCTFDDTAEMLTLHHNQTHLVTGRLEEAEDAKRLAKAMLEFAGDEAFGAVTLVQAPNQILADVGKPAISLISLDTVDALSAEWGTNVDPIRFRGNLLVRGGKPWEEFEWIGKRLQIGEAILEVRKRTERCAATTVNPSTAQRDLQIPKLLMKSVKHIDCGVYARVLQSGAIRCGDQITVL